MTDHITYLSVIIIVGVFLYFLFQSHKMETCRKLINKANKSDNPSNSLDNCKLSVPSNPYRGLLSLKINHIEK